MANLLLHFGMTLVVAASLLVAAATPSSARTIGACMDNRAVQAAISQHVIKTWPAIKAMAGVSDGYKEVSAVRVCEAGGGQPYYVVNVAGPSGESKQLVLNAVDGSN